MNTASTLTFETESGSVYEIDQREKKIRWLSGNSRHHTFPANLQWREFSEISFVAVDKHVIINWDEFGRPTITSAVKAVHGQRAA